MANSVDPDQTAPRSSLLWVHAVCFYNSSVMLGNYLQQTTSADDIFSCIFFLVLLGLTLILLNLDLSVFENTEDLDQLASDEAI